MADRVLVAKVGLDGHDRGVKVVARMLRDAGFEVIYTGLFQTPETVAAAAVDEDVDAIGLSMLSGAHMTLAPKVVEKVRERGADIPVIVGGIIPEQDVARLTEQGVAAVLTPGATADDVVQVVRDAIDHSPRRAVPARPVTDPLERLTNLVALLLETRRPLTLEEITHELRGQYPARDPARRTAFERDKRQLRDEGVPLEQTVLSGDRAGATGYWIDRSRYALPDLGLTDDETRALQLAVATVHLGEDWGGDALLKIGPPELGAAPGERPIVAALASSPDLPQLFAANSERATVSFGYRGRPRRLDPYGLLARSGFWYVIGFDHDADEVRTYRVDRIEGPVVSGPGSAFEIPAGFDPADTFPADAKMVGEGEVVSARVWISAAQAPTVVRELGEAAVAERRPGGDLVVTVPYANRWALRAWVMGLVDDAEILEPEDLRAEMVRWLEELAAGAGAGGPA